jgi:hypothetical protein
MAAAQPLSYTVEPDPEGWVTTGQEWCQIVEQPLGSGLHLIVVLVRRTTAAYVREARIEHRYLTRREGWKRRTVQRLKPADVRIVELALAPAE